MKNCVHEPGPGSRMPWTNTSGADVKAGDLVVAKHCLAVAAVDIKNGDTGSVYLEGVFFTDKVTGHAWLQGEALLWDSSAKKFDYSSAALASGDITGGAIAWVAADSADAIGYFKLTPGNANVGTQVANLNTWATATATKLNADVGVNDTNYDTDPQA